MRDEIQRVAPNSDSTFLVSEHLVLWANKTTAHLDPRVPTRVPLYSEIREALDLLAGTAARYQYLLDQSSTHEWTPVIQGDWTAPFRPTLFPLSMKAWNWPHHTTSCRRDSSERSRPQPGNDAFRDLCVT
jgi:hypothetical protein